MSLQPGMRLGSYEVTAQLGQGGMGGTSDPRLLERGCFASNEGDEHDMSE